MNETEISAAARYALAMLPGVSITRCNTGKLQDRTGRWVTYGLGTGAPDLVGSVDVAVGGTTIARWFCVEVKVPGKEPTLEQWLWGRALQARGGFWCFITSPEEAVAYAIRAKNPEDRGTLIRDLTNMKPKTKRAPPGARLKPRAV